jgi:hypothetical protein
LDDGCKNFSTVHGFGVAVNEFGKSYRFRYLSSESLKVAVNDYRKDDYCLTVNNIKKIAFKKYNDQY